MKKTVLLGTTALIAAGVATSGVAQAAEEPITAGISGYFKSAIGFISQDDDTGQLNDASNSNAFGNNTAINISGSTTLDNGITVGFVSQIEGNSGDNAANGSAALDERWVFFRGSFGQIRMGQVESARQELSQFTPGGASNFGVNTPFFLFGGAGGVGVVSTYSDGIGNNDSLKLIYFSPSFNGFRVGASYAPDDANNGQYGGNATDAAGGLQNNAAIGADFSNNFGDFNLRVMAAWEGYVLENCNASAAVQTCDNNIDVIQFGGGISGGEWSIGVSWQDTELVTLTANGASRDMESYHAGIGWASGPYRAGLEYGKREVDAVDDTTDSFELIELNGTYVLGPGIDLQAAVTLGDFDEGTPGGLSNSFTTFKIGSSIGF